MKRWMILAGIVMSSFLRLAQAGEKPPLLFQDTSFPNSCLGTHVCETPFRIRGEPPLRATSFPNRSLGTTKLLFEDDFTKGAGRWQPTDAAAWKIVKTDKGEAYNQFQLSKYKPPFRSPFNIALVKDLKVADFAFEAKVLSTAKDNAHRDMCVFFGYQDAAHFYYVHMAKKADDHANQIFIVNGADRKKISTKTTDGTPWDDKWHRVKVVRKAGAGSIEIFWDDMKTPIMTAQDKTFAWGQVGIGSFDDSGLWSDVKIHGTRYDK